MGPRLEYQVRLSTIICGFFSPPATFSVVMDRQKNKSRKKEVEMRVFRRTLTRFLIELMDIRN